MTPTELKKLRESIKYTQPQLAELMGVSRESIQSWERGVRPISQANALLAQTKVESVQNALNSITQNQKDFKASINNLLNTGHETTPPMYNEDQMMMVTMANAATCSVTLEFVLELVSIVSKSNLQKVKARAKLLGQEKAQNLDAVLNAMI